MSNRQASAPDPLIPRLLLWVPVGVGAGLALLVLALGSIPLISQLQLQGRLLADKRAQEERLPQLRAELAQVAAQRLVAVRQQQQLITLIAGSGELVTFMALADREARRHGVTLQLFEPTTAQAVAAPETVDPLKGQAKGTREQLEKEASTKARLPNDPLQKAGLRSTNLLLSAQGRYPNLLAFLRGLEALGLLVVQSNLQLSQGHSQGSPGAATPAQATQQAQAVAPIELKLAIALYNTTSQN
ncbi:MAG: hypothetical protein VKM92_07520 [Cyanobacteriota bacterium]|nr:hypothetical protein [Cyanobacteriota bacterium]